MWQKYVDVAKVFGCGKSICVGQKYVNVAEVCGCGRSMWMWQKYVDVAEVCSYLMDVPRNVDEEPQR